MLLIPSPFRRTSILSASSHHPGTHLLQGRTAPTWAGSLGRIPRSSSTNFVARSSFLHTTSLCQASLVNVMCPTPTPTPPFKRAVCVDNWRDGIDAAFSNLTVQMNSRTSFLIFPTSNGMKSETGKMRPLAGVFPQHNPGIQLLAGFFFLPGLQYSGRLVAILALIGIHITEPTCPGMKSLARWLYISRLFYIKTDTRRNNFVWMEKTASLLSHFVLRFLSAKGWLVWWQWKKWLNVTVK